MRPDKEIKRLFKEKASKSPEKYYATEVLKRLGFMRKRCSCGTWFWTVNKEQDHCGDAGCAGGFTLFDNNPCTKEMDYITLWKEFAKMFEKKGYSVLPRYPVVARWNPTMEFTIASIAAFQPYVVSGEVEAPAKRLVIPQFCLRFNDMDNVGITMSHLTGFIMIGQHQFLPKDEWDQEKAFSDIIDWLTKGLGLPYEEITFHEDAWAGGGNFGPCMEFFSRGVELGNQVYMLFEQDDYSPGGSKELKLKVLDMGMGHERNAWFSQGRGTIYDATFPTIIKKLKELTGFKYDKNYEELLERYTRYAAFLNLDEIDDIDKAWNRVAKEMNMSAKELRAKILPLSALYSVAEHARSLLFALTDGGLPSNVGGGYNLRMIFRRAQSFIDDQGWSEKVNIGEVAKYHAEYLKPLFPELLKEIDEVQSILEVEKKKYYENKRRSHQILKNEVKRSRKFDADRVVQLYDVFGIEPESIRLYLNSIGEESFKVPDNFYALVAEKHEQREQKAQTRRKKRFNIEDLPKTTVLYYDSYDYVDFESPVIRVVKVDREKKEDGDRDEYSGVILERTAFYPTSGGQEHDTGTLGGVNVIDVIKQDGIIIHILEKKVSWKRGEIVNGKVDIRRREQLAQHHTATHIINGVARSILGNHVWQAGAAKSEEKARIDITHYSPLTNDQLQRIEEEANKVVQLNLPIKKVVEQKNLAEAEYGFRLYQGGAVPGKEIRVVEIPGLDTEACGGTHLNTTGECGRIKILRSTKVQDGIIRIEFVAGETAKRMIEKEKEEVEELKRYLGVKDVKLIPDSAKLLFEMWKGAKKVKKKQKPFNREAFQRELVVYDGDILSETAKILQTQQEHILSTLKRFSKEIEEIEKVKKK